jgi:hypothetical protein
MNYSFLTQPGSCSIKQLRATCDALNTLTYSFVLTIVHEQPSQDEDNRAQKMTQKVILELNSMTIPFNSQTSGDEVC